MQVNTLKSVEPFASWRVCFCFFPVVCWTSGTLRKSGFVNSRKPRQGLWLCYSCDSFISLLQSLQTERQLNDARALIEQRQIEFVSKSQMLPLATSRHCLLDRPHGISWEKGAKMCTSSRLFPSLAVADKYPWYCRVIWPRINTDWFFSHWRQKPF